MNQPNASDHHPTTAESIPPPAKESPAESVLGRPPAGGSPAGPGAGQEAEPARWELRALWLFMAGMALASVAFGIWLWRKCK